MSFLLGLYFLAALAAYYWVTLNPKQYLFTFPPEHVWSEISETVMALIFVPGIITYKKILCFYASVQITDDSKTC